MAGHDVLMVTLPPFEGGVPAKTRILCNHLAALGHRVTVAWYATFAHHSQANAACWQILAGRHPTTVSATAFDHFSGYAVGSWLPELEAPYYLLSHRWQDLIDCHDRHIAVGGSPMVGHILAQAGVPHFLWCASDVMADRRDRQSHMPWPRSVVDALVTRPWLRRQQRFILQHSPLVLGVSRYTTAQMLRQGARADRTDRLPIPVDPRYFTPATAAPSADIIGFAARFEDPRKNLPLLLDAMALLRRRRPHAKLHLAGCDPSPATLARVSALGLAACIHFAGAVPAGQLADFYRSLDVFALPSWQEGLCLAGLEAMACGVPVVSTDCGGPADFVRTDISGILVKDWRADSLAQALDRALTNRAALSAGARALVVSEFSPSAFANGIATAWNRVWKEAP